jgi:hypothetical protein
MAEAPPRLRRAPRTDANGLRGAGFMVRTTGSGGLCALALKAHLTDIRHDKVACLVIGYSSRAPPPSTLRLAEVCAQCDVPCLVFGWRHLLPDPESLPQTLRATGRVSAANACAYGKPGRRPIHCWSWGLADGDLGRVRWHCPAESDCLFGRTHKRLPPSSRRIFPDRYLKAVAFTAMVPVRALHLGV